MTDVENLEKIIFDVFGIRKNIKNKKNTNGCISVLNRANKNHFAYNFLNRLFRLKRVFAENPIAIKDICEKIKNIGESKNAQWAGPYSELVALDFYTQFSEFFSVSYINILKISEHKDSIPAKNGQKEIIDIDLCLHLKNDDIFTDVKSFNCIHLQIFDQIFDEIEEFASKSLGKSVLLGVDNISEIDYREVKNHLGSEKNKIKHELKRAVSENLNNLVYESISGLKFNFKINYSSKSAYLSTVKEYSPFAMAEAYKYKFLDYGNKLIDNEYSLITIVRNPWFNEETVDFGDFNNFFYRSLSRRTFMELLKIDENASEYSHSYANENIKVSEISKNLAGIIFIDDNSPSSNLQKNLYSVYIYLNPNYSIKNPEKIPLTIRKMEKYFRNKFECQIKDFDDFKNDNY